MMPRVATGLSNAAIDRLGARMRVGPISDEDSAMLGEWQASFAPMLSEVVAFLRDDLGLAPSARSKVLQSTVAKLHRQPSLNLSQLQDVVGCRVVVPGIPEQDGVVRALIDRYPEARVHDRRVAPSYGYRAVHVVPTIRGRRVEVQVRTWFQEYWALLSEAGGTPRGSLKYGEGPGDEIRFLAGLSTLFRWLEEHGRSAGDFFGAGDPDPKPWWLWRPAERAGFRRGLPTDYDRRASRLLTYFVREALRRRR